jgi:hypothetical protein
MLRAMHSETSLWVAGALYFLVFLVLDPVIVAAIAYAAWKGKPKNFNREMYWTAFAASMVVSGVLMVFAQRMHADVRTWQYFLQTVCLLAGALLFGVSGGCFLGIFIYRR